MNKLKEAKEWAVAAFILLVVVVAILMYGVYVLLALTFLLATGGLLIIVNGLIEMGRGFSSLFQRSLTTLKRERREGDD